MHAGGHQELNWYKCFILQNKSKIMLDVFRLEYKEIEDNLTNWKWKKMLKEMMGHKRHNNAFPNAQILFKFWYSNLCG